MKKTIFALGMLCMAISIAAQSITSTSRIVIEAAGQPDKMVDFVLSSSFSDGFDNTWDAVAANPGGIYVYGGERYTTWASNAYTANLAVGFKATTGITDYTLRFENFKGTEYTLVDMVDYQVITVNASTSDYSFSVTSAQAASGATINDRFVINYPLPSGQLETCFTGTVLQINNNPIFGKIYVKWKSSGTDRVVELDRSAPSIDFTEARFGSATNYTIEFGSGANKHAFNVTVTR